MSISHVIPATVLLLVLLSSPGTDGLVPDARMSGGGTEIGASRGQKERDEHEAKADRPEYLLDEFRRAPLCDVSGPTLSTPLNGECPPAQGTISDVNTCGEDTPLEPMWRRHRDSVDTPWGPWRNVDLGGCGVDILPVLTEADFRRLPIPAPALTMQPDRGWVLVNMSRVKQMAGLGVRESWG